MQNCVRSPSAEYRKRFARICNGNVAGAEKAFGQVCPLRHPSVLWLVLYHFHPAGLCEGLAQTKECNIIRHKPFKKKGMGIKRSFHLNFLSSSGWTTSQWPWCRLPLPSTLRMDEAEAPREANDLSRYQGHCHKHLWFGHGELDAKWKIKMFSPLFHLSITNAWL